MRACVCALCMWCVCVCVCVCACVRACVCVMNLSPSSKEEVSRATKSLHMIRLELNCLLVTLQGTTDTPKTHTHSKTHITHTVDLQHTYVASPATCLW